MTPIELVPWPELEASLRVLFSAIAGGIIGLERGHAHKPAGIRTNSLVCLGSALLTILSLHAFSSDVTDTSRVAAGIAIGIGFLGAGTIIRTRWSISCLTTAATIWVGAAIGMAFGAGFYIIATVTWTITLGLLMLPIKKINGDENWR
jgi:putative Mg2+ transporter-C (MgtC) family protein